MRKGQVQAIVLTLVLVVALIGLYFIFKGPGMATGPALKAGAWPGAEAWYWQCSTDQSIENKCLKADAAKEACKGGTLTKTAACYSPVSAQPPLECRFDGIAEQVGDKLIGCTPSKSGAKLEGTFKDGGSFKVLIHSFKTNGFIANVNGKTASFTYGVPLSVAGLSIRTTMLSAAWISFEVKQEVTPAGTTIAAAPKTWGTEEEFFCKCLDDQGKTVSAVKVDSNDAAAVNSCNLGCQRKGAASGVIV
jgi:hypothetical protein